MGRKPESARRRGWLVRHWRAAAIAVVVFTWEFGMNVALQKGFFDSTPNVVCFLLLFLPLIALGVLGAFHPWMRKRYGVKRSSSVGIVLSGFIALSISGVCLWRITHPNTPTTANKNVTAPMSSTNAVTTTNALPENVAPVVPPVVPVEKHNSDNTSIMIGGDNSGNVANVNNSPGANIKQSIGDPRRKISQPKADEIKKLLKKTSPLEMDIAIDMSSGDEVAGIADQIRDIFRACDYQNAGYNRGSYLVPLRGVVIRIPGTKVDDKMFRPSDTNLVEALRILYSEIGEKPKLDLAPKNAIYFEIGMRE